MDELRAAAAKPPPEPSTKALEEAIAAHTSSLREDSRVSSANVKQKETRAASQARRCATFASRRPGTAPPTT